MPDNNETNTTTLLSHRFVSKYAPRNHSFLPSPNIPLFPKGDAVHGLDVILEMIDVLEN